MTTLTEIRALALAATPPCANCCVRLDCFCHCCALADAMTTERVLALLDVIEAAKAMRDYAGVIPGAYIFDAALAALDKEQNSTRSADA